MAKKCRHFWGASTLTKSGTYIQTCANCRKTRVTGMNFKLIY